MSEKKITLKVTVKPNGDNGWRTVCNAYPQIVGEGRSCEDALASLVGKIHEEFKEGTFKLDSQLIPAISCQITEMKANLILGTENYTLSDFIEEAEPEEMHECEDCGKGCSCVECLKAGEDTCGEEPENKVFPDVEKTPCDECSGYMRVCSGNIRDKYACPSSYPVCIKCENKQSLTYQGKEGDIVKFNLDCKVHGIKETTIDCGVCDTFNCEDYKYKVITEAETTAKPEAESAA